MAISANLDLLRSVRTKELFKQPAQLIVIHSEKELAINGTITIGQFIDQSNVFFKWIRAEGLTLSNPDVINYPDSILIQVENIHSIRKSSNLQTDPSIIIVQAPDSTRTQLRFENSTVCFRFIFQINKHLKPTVSSSDENLLLLNGATTEFPPVTVNTQPVSNPILGQSTTPQPTQKSTFSFPPPPPSSQTTTTNPQPQRHPEVHVPQPQPQHIPQTVLPSDLLPSPPTPAFPSEDVFTWYDYLCGLRLVLANEADVPSRLLDFLSVPLTHSALGSFLTADGSLKRTTLLFTQILLNGCSPLIRPEIWPFLFGLFEDSSSDVERMARREDMTDEYLQLQTLLANTVPEQLYAPQGSGDMLHASVDFHTRQLIPYSASAFTVSRSTSSSITSLPCRACPEGIEQDSFTKLASTIPFVSDSLRRIELDLERTDREQETMIDADDSPFYSSIRRILQAHAVIDPSLGYVQGMNDLCSLIMHAMLGDSCLSFFSLSSLMRPMRPFYFNPSDSLSAFFHIIFSLLILVDRPFALHLLFPPPNPSYPGIPPSLSSAGLMFLFSQTILLFKREFEFDDACQLWEAMLAFGHLERMFDLSHQTQHEQVPSNASSPSVEHAIAALDCKASQPSTSPLVIDEESQPSPSPNPTTPPSLPSLSLLPFVLTVYLLQNKKEIMSSTYSEPEIIRLLSNKRESQGRATHAKTSSSQHPPRRSRAIHTLVVAALELYIETFERIRELRLKRGPIQKDDEFAEIELLFMPGWGLTEDGQRLWESSGATRSSKGHQTRSIFANDLAKVKWKAGVSHIEQNTAQNGSIEHLSSENQT
ncbi:putative Rab-GTPase-TBC domain containing protein [Blattamonas nauphoetae]|uniref:Rab-GTPase-TBC domain containing protein n=1 Tax=Blattamonas nauphoetae TaxID=2049346 RepID=A0ABQ9WQY1_9EUKA|nr:putative Rab-GTPase-TBC domain containing protein [Blattamonas nauphoetae]